MATVGPLNKTQGKTHPSAGCQSIIDTSYARQQPDEGDERLDVPPECLQSRPRKCPAYAGRSSQCCRLTGAQRISISLDGELEDHEEDLRQFENLPTRCRHGSGKTGWNSVILASRVYDHYGWAEGH